MTTTAPTRRRVRARTVVALSVAAALLIMVAAAAWVGTRAVQAKDQLEHVIPLAADLRTAGAAGDIAALMSASDQLAAHAGRAADLTGDPVWRLAEVTPFVGDDLAAVRIASSQLSAVATSALSPLLAAADDIATRSSGAGAPIDVAALREAGARLKEAMTVLSTADAELSQIDPDALIPQLAEGVGTLQTSVGEGSAAVTQVSAFADVLPAMLGADGPRNVLVMLQNNAELRTGGGITGSFAMLRADAGDVSLVSQADSSDFRMRDSSILPLPDATTALYSDVVGRFVQNASMPADFALSAQLASTWWQAASGVAPDAVLSIDPIVLQSLLEVTGPLALADGSVIDADNLVQRLLVDPYMTLDPDSQTQFQHIVTEATFEHLLSDGIEPLGWAKGLTGPISQGRVSMWSAHAAEQDVIAQSALAGPLARHRAAGPDAYAVYLNDATGAKMDAFLDVGIDSGVVVCREDGHRDTVVSVTLTSTAPADAAGFPASMTGGGAFGTAPGNIATNVSVAAPAGSFIGGVTRDGEPVAAAGVDDDGYPTSAVRVDLAPGETATVDFRFVTADSPTAHAAIADTSEADAGDTAVTIVHTPMLRPPSVGVAEPACA